MVEHYIESELPRAGTIPGEGEPVFRAAYILESEHRSGLILPDWPAVERALTMFGNDAIGASTQPDAGLDTLDDLGDGARDLMMRARGASSMDSLSPFIADLAGCLRERVERVGIGSKSFDWEGPGPFMKTSIEVNSDPETNLLVLSLGHGGSSDIEIGLARYLDVPRALNWKQASVRFIPDCGQDVSTLEQVNIDLAGLAMGLRNAGIAIEADELARAIYDKNEFEQESVPLEKTAVSETSLRVAGTRSRCLGPWEIDESVLKVPLIEFPLHSGKYNVPSIDIYVRPPKPSDFIYKPAVGERQQAEFEQVIARISAVLRNTRELA